VSEIAKAPVLDGPRFAPCDEQPTLIPAREWLLRDTLGGEREVVIARPPAALVESGDGAPTR
jgi:hypothetical protein